MSEILLHNIKKMDYPSKPDFVKWTKYLNRKLTVQEKKYIIDYMEEIQLNESMTELRVNINKKNLCIGHLTDLDGNCLFESLKYHKLFDNELEFRRKISTLMMIFKNEKNIFANQEESLEDLFNMSNYEEYVYVKKSQKMYKYTFELMCYDLSLDKSWNRLPTELLLMFISLICKTKIIILSNQNEYAIEIDKSELENPNTIYLGHINESHYVPLISIDCENDKILKHNEAKGKYHKWGIRCWMRRYNYTSEYITNNLI